jgi:hypothetical protein
MVKGFWILAFLDACLLLTFLFLTLTQKGHSDGGREMALVFFILLPLTVLGATVAVFTNASQPLIRWVCVAIVALPPAFYAKVGAGLLQSNIRNNPVNQYESQPMRQLIRAVTRLDVDEVRRWAPLMDKSLDQGQFNAPMRLAIDLMVKEQQTRLPAQTAAHLAILKILLENGAKPNEALQVACWTRSAELLHAMFQAGADPNFSAQYSGPVFFSCLDRGITAGSFVPVVEEFLAAGVNVNAKSSSGFLPASYAADSDQFDVALLLLSHGADPDAKDDRGESLRSKASEKAAAFGDRAPDALKALLSRLK